MTVADLLAGALVRAGTRALFGVPGGGSNLDVMEAARREGLGFVLTQTETGAALMASAQAEITGSPGACLCTLGPGVASIVNGVAHAWLDRVPLIVCSDTLPYDVRDRYEHQHLRHAALLGPITKRSVDLSAADAPRAIAAALACAVASRPGPVHLDCSPDVAAATVSDFREESLPATPQPPASLDADDERLLRSARRPVLIAGLDSRGTGAGGVRSLAEARGIPVLTTYKAKGVISDDHPLWAGLFTLGAIERPLLQAADLLLTFGLDPVELLPRPGPTEPAALHCGRDLPSSGQLAGRPCLTGDLAHAATAILGVLRSSDWTQAEISRERERQKAAVLGGEAFAPGAAVAAIGEATGAQVRFTIDAGAHMFPAMTLLPARRPGQILISNGLSTMGYALPAAIGAALLDRSKPVVAVTGDAGLLMCLGELATAAREGLSLVVVVFADDELSLIRLKQERRGLAPMGMHLGQLQWARAADTFGFRAFRATDAASLHDQVCAALSAGGPALVEARVNPEAYAKMAMTLRG